MLAIQMNTIGKNQKYQSTNPCKLFTIHVYIATKPR